MIPVLAGFGMLVALILVLKWLLWHLLKEPKKDSGLGLGAFAGLGALMTLFRGRGGGDKD